MASTSTPPSTVARGSERKLLRPYYKAMSEIVARKVTASLQVAGLDLQAAPEAAGASHQSGESIRSAMQLGEVVYRALVDKKAA